MRRLCPIAPNVAAADLFASNSPRRGTLCMRTIPRSGRPANDVRLAPFVEAAMENRILSCPRPLCAPRMTPRQKPAAASPAQASPAAALGGDVARRRQISCGLLRFAYTERIAQE